MTGATAQAVKRQQVIQLPAGAKLQVIGDDQGGEAEDGGPKVHMPVSLNIDRHLIKAQGFLEGDKFSSAFRMLHDVIEGRTLTEEGGESEPDQDATEDIWSLTSAKQAVFSNDDRLYHPVRRLCHELLASLPPEGVAAYRAEFEYEAKTALDAAKQSLDLRAFEAVYERFFVTIAAAHAMELAGDLHMDRGQFRAALQSYRSLIEVYPEDARREAGIDDSYVQFKMALCFAQMRDRSEAERTLRDVAPEATLRIMGELAAADELASHPALDSSATEPRLRRTSAPTASFSIDSELVPLWEFRFENPHPYRIVRESKRRHSGWGVGNNANTSVVSLSPNVCVPGTTVSYIDDRVVFLDHYRVRLHEALSGRMMLESRGPLQETTKPNRPRARVPVYDYATSKPVSDGSRVFVVLTSTRAAEAGPLLGNHIEAVDRETLATVWATAGDSAFAGLTFLAAPTVFGDKLLVPVLERGTVALQCIDAATGSDVYRVAIHRGGTQLTRPISTPVVVEQGLAFVMANAGALAAIDAHTGTVRWTRRYERVHPLRPRPMRNHRTNRTGMFGYAGYTELTRLPGFSPSELISVDGLVVFAPADGGVLICLDGATGEPVWMLNREQIIPGQDNKSRWKYIIGHDDQHLVLGGEHDVTCVELRTGIRQWRLDLPTIPGVAQWRGRGVVHDGAVIVPGLRELLWRPLDAPRDRRWARIALPELSIGREPLAGPFNLQVDGMFLTACHEGGVEVYSSIESLTDVARDAERPGQRALLQAQAGDLTGAFETLHAVDVSELTQPRREEFAQRILTIANELAIAMAAHGARAEALSVLDRCRSKLDQDRDVMRWHLARIEVFRALADYEAIEAEQLALYARMEGR